MLVRGFRFIHEDAQVPLADGSQRLLALLALHGRPIKRILVAGMLWPEVTEGRAYASLRSALSRLYGIVRHAVEVSPTDLRLTSSVSVDLLESRALAHRLLDAVDQPSDADLSRAAVTALSRELLPDWYDDWVLLEAEEWRQLRLHALEALTGWLTADRRFADAAAAGLAAIRADPLRESAHSALIRVHLAENNRSEALRELKRYEHLLREELDIAPTAQLTQLAHSTPIAVTRR